MPQVKSGFILRSKSPNFERDSFDTLSEMKYVNKEHIDEGHLSYCKETKKYYTFSIEHTYDNITGYWKELITCGGEVDLGDFEDRLNNLQSMIDELYEGMYPVSCELLTSNGTKDLVVEYEEKEKTLPLTIGIKHKGVTLDRGDVDELKITASNATLGNYDKFSDKVDITIPADANGNHSASLNVAAKNQTCEAKCNIYQRVPIFLGWSQNAEPNSGMLNSGTLMTKKVATTSKGTYNFGEVGIGFYFWTFIPANGVTHYSKVEGNGYEMVMQDAGTITYKGQQYICKRKPEASVLASDKWKIVLS